MPDAPTAETHCCIGMFRPPFADVLDAQKRLKWTYSDGRVYEAGKFGYVKSEYTHPWHKDGVDKLKQDWLLGYFDTPVYKTHEEVIRAKEKT